MSSFTPLVNYNYAEAAAAAAGGGVVGNELTFPRDPSPSDLSGPTGAGYQLGQLWYSSSSSTLFVLTSVSGGVATWSPSTAALLSPLSVPSGGTGRNTLLNHGVVVGAGTSAVTSLAVGTNGQVLIGSTGADPVFGTLTSSDGTVTFTTGAGTLDLSTSLNADFASPPPIGSVAPNTGAFTTLSATGTTTLAALNQTGTANLNTSGAAITTIGTGGTGAVRIGNATGNTAVTGTLTSTAGITASTGNITATLGNVAAGAAVSAATTVTAGTGITSTTGDITAAAGNLAATLGSVSAGTSVTAGTSITATLGDITATNGNLVLTAVGNKLVINASSSATCSAGTFVLGGGATTVVSNSAVTASSLILLTPQALGTVAIPSALAVTALNAGVSFTVTPSDATDTSTVAYLIIN